MANSLTMKLFHTLWFVFLLIEANFIGAMINIKLFVFLILLLAQSIRMYSMKKLGAYWTVTIMRLDKCKLYDRGLYKIVRHPNYFAVILEFIFLPLLFKAYFTLFIFSFLNLFILKKRIELEENELIESCNYLETFGNTKKLIPFLY
ncbi:MAG: isoprenylcysteine carboxylmethyltransferase family protein [Bacteriovorax sp.]